MVGKSILLFVLPAIAEIGGAYLVWFGLKDDRCAWFVIAGGLALVAYGVIASLQPDAEFGRVLAAYGGVFIAGSLAWGVAFDGFRPDRYDIAGAGCASWATRSSCTRPADRNPQRLGGLGRRLRVAVRVGVVSVPPTARRWLACCRPDSTRGPSSPGSRHPFPETKYLLAVGQRA